MADDEDTGSELAWLVAAWEPCGRRGLGNSSHCLGRVLYLSVDHQRDKKAGRIHRRCFCSPTPTALLREQSIFAQPPRDHSDGFLGNAGAFGQFFYKV